MANNKVQLANGTVLIDLTDTTATAEDVAAGKYFYNAAGVKVEGSASGSSDPYVIVTGETNSGGGKTLYITGAVDETIISSGGGDLENISATVLLDLSDDTIAADKLAYGYTAHNSMGQAITGTKPAYVTITGENDISGGKIKYLSGDVNQTITTDSAGGDIGNLSATVLLDLSDDTVKADKLLSGYTAHDSMGQAVIGTYTPPAPNLGTKTITVNDTYIASADELDGYSSVTVNVPVPEGYIIPSGSQTITENDTYDISSLASVTVNVPVPQGYIIPSGSQTLTENDTYDVTGLASVTVNVPPPTLGTKTITTNGTYTASSDSLDGYSSVTVDVAGNTKIITLNNSSLWTGNASFSNGAAVGASYDDVMHLANSGNRIVLINPIENPAGVIRLYGNTGFDVAICTFDSNVGYLGNDAGYIKKWADGAFTTDVPQTVTTTGTYLGILLRRTGGTVALNPADVAEVGFRIEYAGVVELQDKTVTPTRSTQVIEADSNYDGLSSVTVNPIPNTYIVPSGQLAVTANGVVNVSQYASIAVNVPSSGNGSITQDQSGAVVLDPSGSGAGIKYTIDNVANRILDEGSTLVIPNATYILPYTFCGQTALTTVNAPKVTAFKTPYDTVGSYVFYKCTNVTSIYMPRLSGTGSGGYQFAGCTKLASIYMPKAGVGQHMFDGDTSLTQAVVGSGGNSASFKSCSKLAICDWSTTKFSTEEFSGCSQLTTLILRSTSLVTMSNTNAFTNTPFKSGGTGGTIYIPKVLYDKLGTGSSDYRAATNWVTYNGYGTITWAQIEGSQYENYYGDGTGVLKSVTYSLTQCTRSDDMPIPAYAEYGSAWSVTLTPNEGYSMSSVVVTMAGNDVTSTVYNSSTGGITINSVTGAITITATAS